MCVCMSVNTCVCARVGVGVSPSLCMSACSMQYPGQKGIAAGAKSAGTSTLSVPSRMVEAMSKKLPSIHSAIDWTLCVSLMCCRKWCFAFICSKPENTTCTHSPHETKQWRQTNSKHAEALGSWHEASRFTKKKKKDPKNNKTCISSFPHAHTHTYTHTHARSN